MEGSEPSEGRLMRKWEKCLGNHGKRNKRIPWKRSGSAPGNALRTGLRLALMAIVSALTGCADSGGEPVYEAEFVDLDIPEADYYGINIAYSLFSDELYYVTRSSGEIDPDTGFRESTLTHTACSLGKPERRAVFP